MKTYLLLFVFAVSGFSQETVAPTGNEKVGPVRGENRGDYNIVQSWEMGYRYTTVGGNEGMYRSAVNFRNGVRLLGSSMTANSKDGHGKYFDEIVLTTQGLGNDPYESASLRVQKNRLYQYNLLWRQNDYYNPALTVASGQHLLDTTHRWQDHDLLLFPNAKVRVKAGYSRVAQAGPALSTELLFDTRGDVIPLFRNVRREYNEYRLGGDVDLGGFRFSFLHRWQYSKEDTTDNVGVAVQVGSTTITTLNRAEPYHGSSPSWMGNLFGERKWFVLNARVVYTSGNKNLRFNENATGIDRFGSAASRQVLVSGNGGRPMLTGDASFVVFPVSRWTIVNNTSVVNLRITGNNYFQQFDNGTFSYDQLNFSFLGIRMVTNSTDLRFKPGKKFDVFGGFRYTDRLIRSTTASAVPTFPYDSVSYEQTNVTKAGAFGFNWLPWQRVRVHAEGEVGRNDNPFTPVSERNYHAIRGRAQYRTKTMTLGIGYTENYNTNSIVLTSYSSHSRTYWANGSWMAGSRVSLDGSYSKLHLDTTGGIAFFAGSPRPQYQTAYSSIYLSNIHAANFGARLVMNKRADLYVGYSITKDAGDGRGSLAAQSNAIQQVLYNAQTFPLTYQSPMLRVSVKLNAKVRWNLGYQYYGYNEQFGVVGAYQNFRAQTGFTSLLWAF